MKYPRQLASRRPQAHAGRIADRIVLPRPFTHDAYQVLLTDVSGMPTRLLPLPAALPGSGSMLTGMTVRLNNTAYIFYRADTSLIHQLHVIHHELFHAMEHHPGMLVSDPVIKDALAQLLRPDLPNLSSELIRHLVGRSCRVGEFQDKHERDAERFAVVMAYRLGLTVPMNGENDAKPEADRLHRLLSNGCP